MITFDLINERKIEVRHRIDWFSQDELSEARDSKHLTTRKRTNKGREDGRQYKLKFRSFTRGHEDVMLAILHILVSVTHFEVK